MSARIDEQDLADIPWLVATGERTAVFHLLGEHQAESIRTLTDSSETIEELRRDASLPAVAEHLAIVRDLSRSAYPAVWSELAAMADGAGVPVDDLALVNLRGDYGAEALGCSDVALVDVDRAVIAHNEDGPADLRGHGRLLTLALDDEPTVTVWWHPGFIPSNTFVVNEFGVAWGIDNIRVIAPAEAPGRHFVARALQRCRDLREVTAYLRDNISAGGFAYNIGQVGHARAVHVETAAGRYAEAVAEPGRSDLLWHTNHLRYLSPDLDAPFDNSHLRAQVASTWTVPERNAVDWCLDLLAVNTQPRGVHRDGKDGDPLVTLVTIVVDLLANTVTVAPCDGPPAMIPASDLARGIARNQCPYKS